MKPLRLLAMIFCFSLLLSTSGCFEEEEEIIDKGPGPEVLAEKALEKLKDEPFDPSGWETVENPQGYGSPHAKKGGLLKVYCPEYPATLSPVGPNSRHSIISRMNGLVGERLLMRDQRTNRYKPWLASHWKISEDGKFYWYRIDPRARWADGKPVTALDVVESFKLLSDKRVRSAWHNSFWPKNFELPVALTRDVVRFEVKDPSRLKHIYLSGGLLILPAHQIMGDYVHSKFYRLFNWKYYAGSGPYELDYTRRGRNVTFIRRKDWWAEDLPQFQGCYNFKRIKFIVVKDENLTFEKFKKGALDVYVVNIAKRWAKECDFDKIKKGWIQKRQIWNERAQGIQGFALNTTRWPFDDIKVRKAFAYLYHREKLIDKLFFNQYIHMDSHFPASVYECPDNEPIRFDPVKAQKLLAEAGYTERNEKGILVDEDGRPLDLTLQYSSKSSERIYTVYKEALKSAGIKLNLKLSTRTATFKMMLERNFRISNVAWTSPRPPMPRGGYHSDSAQQKGTSNVSGVAIPKLDELIEAYEVEPDPKKQIELMRKIDHIAYNNHHYILAWYCPFVRLLYWNKFGMPKYIYDLTGYYYWPTFTYWWEDPEKKAALEKAVENDEELPVGPLNNKFWMRYRESNGENWNELQKAWSKFEKQQ